MVNPNQEPDEGTAYLLDGDNVPALPDRRPMDARLQPKKKDRGPIPARQGNGYYADHVTGDRLRSVTTILSGGVPKDALPFWAAAVCTDSAIENLPALVAASRYPDRLAEMRDYIKRAHTRKKDERADVGHTVHFIIEARILGLELPPTIKIGDGDDAQEVALDGPELGPFVENFLAFEELWKPRFTASEMVVANPTDGYAGTLDYMIDADGPIGEALAGQRYPVMPDDDLMGDTKTGGTFEREVVREGRVVMQSPALTTAGHVHGVYPEAGLQMSAYRHAEVCWLRDGSRVPMPSTAQVGIVLHLRPEGFRIYPALCGDDQYAYFRYAQMVDEWSSRIASPRSKSPIIGKPLELPAASKAVA